MGNVIETIVDGFKTSTKAAREISKASFNDTREMSAELRGRGIKEGFKQGCQEAREFEKQFRDDAINLRGTQDLLQNGIITIPNSGVGRSKKA